MEKRQTEPYLSAYLHSKGRRLGLPISGTFELTARCNFSCPMCYVHLNQSRAEDELTAEQWIALAREARDQGMVFALLTGGEPFIRKDFFEIYGAMKKMGLLISINTNGSLLTGEIRKKLLEDPPFRVNISLYGGCHETYKTMCGQDAFETVVANIRALHDAGVDVRLNLSITPYNRQDLWKIFEISRELGVHVKGTSYMYPPIRINGEFGTGNRLTPEEAAACSVEWDQLRFTQEEFALRAEAMHQMRPVDLPECPVESEEGVRCRAGSSSFWMTWDGKMTPCGMMTSPVAYPMEIGFNAAWQTILKQTAQIRTPGKCTVCPKKDVCAVCASVCLTETGSFVGVPEYMCQMTDSIIEQTWNAHSKGKDTHYADSERAD